MILGPIPERRISVELTDIELDEGFRRVFRLVDLNHTILYTQGPEGKMEIKKVVVFGTEQGLPPPLLTAADPDRDESPADGRGPMLHTEMLGEAAWLPGDNEANTVMTHIQKAIERYRKQRSQLPDEGKNEGVRRFQQGIEQAIRAQTELPSPPRTVDEIIALIPRELEGYQPFTAGQAESETLHHLDAPPRP